MVTPRTLAMFHFGFALVFSLVCGFIVYVLHFVEPTLTPSAPPQEYSISLRQSILQEQNVENLRKSALTYYDHWDVLTRATIASNHLALQLIYWCLGTTSLLLTIGGVMSLRVRTP